MHPNSVWLVSALRDLVWLFVLDSNDEQIKQEFQDFHDWDDWCSQPNSRKTADFAQPLHEPRHSWSKNGQRANRITKTSPWIPWNVWKNNVFGWVQMSPVKIVILQQHGESLSYLSNLQSNCGSYQSSKGSHPFYFYELVALYSSIFIQCTWD